MDHNVKYKHLIKAVVIVHSELAGVLEVSDPVQQDGLVVADAECQITSKLCGVLHQEQSIRPTTEQLLNLDKKIAAITFPICSEDDILMKSLLRTHNVAIS